MVWLRFFRITFLVSIYAVNATKLTNVSNSHWLSEPSSINNLHKNGVSVFGLNDLDPHSSKDYCAEVRVSGLSDISQTEKGTFHVESNYNVTQTIKKSECPTLETASSLTQTQLIQILTAPCRYNRLERPMLALTNTVYVRVYISAINNPEPSDLFKVQGLIQLQYMDSRLAFGEYVPNRTQAILGESELRDLIWVPHIFIANEEQSSILGTNEKDILTSIAADGTVIISSRIQTTLFCWMNLQKFPFDDQQCSTILESWMYNSSELLLLWEQKSPITLDPKIHLSGYTIQNVWSNETIIKADLNDFRRGAFIGNYSALSFTVHLTREAGYYVMDYFLPSMMIVAISWVTFWLQADNTPARTVLGTSTLLSFITLASSQEKNLPKGSYMKISEVWFLGCTCFIFGSLVEFAFVNTIWRRKRSLKLKKVNSKHILKSTLTPTINRQETQNDKCCFDSYLSFETPVAAVSSNIHLSSSANSTKGANINDINTTEKDTSWSALSPHEASLWIDRKARFIFPLTFLIFNAIFWTFVYCL